MNQKIKESMKAGRIIFYIIAALCLLAGTYLVFFIRGRDYIGCFLWGIAVLLFVYRFLICRQMKKLRNVLTLLLVLGVGIFAAAEAQVVKDAVTDTDIQADYVILLGSRVRGTRPTVSMQDRLECAYKYLRENPEVSVIVSGGQGAGEDISEAEAMRVWLEGKGIDKGRIIKEDRSTSTEENLKYSFEKIRERGGSPRDGVGIISSEYHLHRAKKLAEDLGATPYGIAAGTSIFLVKVNYFIREALGVIYMWIMVW